ncbi:hypothetical protein PUN28_004285 [Cardiocondyla obscurior]|uniref:Uncharacterized protein n=1 Tax=Cardiocondyla obscurior TaxID=286306 RepID=A0AAW2GBN0_9HYME
MHDKTTSGAVTASPPTDVKSDCVSLPQLSNSSPEESPIVTLRKRIRRRRHKSSQPITLKFVLTSPPSLLLEAAFSNAPRILEVQVFLPQQPLVGRYLSRPD